MQKNKKKYSCYEEGVEGSYTEEELKQKYDELVGKTEYPDYEGWLWDMLRSGVVTKRGD